MRNFLIISLLFSLFNPLPETSKAQMGSPLEEARKGDQAYDAGEHEKALRHYENAEEKGLKDPKLRFNKGDALYQLEKYADAARAFRGLASGSDDPSLRAKAYHNLGNSHLKAGRLDKSIEAYKEALRLKPGDEDTRYNLALAKKLKKKSQQNEKKKKKKEDRKKEKQDRNKKKDGEKKKDQKGKKDRNKDGKSGDREKDDENKGQGQKGDREKEQKKDQRKKQQAGKKGEKEKGEKKKKARALSPEEVKRLLKAMEANEAEVQRKLLRKKKKQKEGEKKDVEKDW
jgi:Ca-activated chloride channel family protein